MAVARVSKITASSTKSFQEAAEEGLKRATKTTAAEYRAWTEEFLKWAHEAATESEREA